MFCSKCGTLGYYMADGRLQCKNCKQLDAPISDVILITGEKINIKNSLITSTGEPEMRTYDVIEILKLPTTDAYYCPKCEARESTCELRQMDQTDEPEVAFLQCQVCGYGWRQ